MAAATTTFDRHYEGKALLAEVPSGVDAKGFDFHYEGMAIVAETESGVVGGPFPFYTRRTMEAGLVDMRG